MNDDQSVPVHEHSRLGLARYAADVATRDQQTARDVVTALVHDCARLTATVSSMDAKDASGPLDQRHELSLLATRRELSQKTAHLEQARATAAQCDKDAALACALRDVYDRRYTEAMRRMEILIDDFHRDTEMLVVRDRRELIRIAEFELDFTAGAPHSDGVTATV